MSSVEGAAITGLDGLNVAITGAGRDLGRALAIAFAKEGANLFLSARTLSHAQRTAGEIEGLGGGETHALRCDLTKPETIAAFAEEVAERAAHVDVLVNNGAGWLEGRDVTAASDQAIAETIDATITGTILTVRSFLPLLSRSARPDIVNMVSAAGIPDLFESGSAHVAYYAAKTGEMGFARTIAKQLRPQGVRVVSLYPPDFDNVDPLSSAYAETSRTASDKLTSISIIECIMFALTRPRDCFMQELRFAP